MIISWETIQQGLDVPHPGDRDGVGHVTGEELHIRTQVYLLKWANNGTPDRAVILFLGVY